MSDAMRDGEALPRAFRRAHRGLLVAAGLLIVGMACVGPAFVRLIYDDRYAATAELIRLLAVAAWFTALLVPGELALLALGDTRGLAAGQAVRMVCVPALLLGGYSLAGLPGLILGVACGELIRYAVVAYFLGRAGVRAYPADAAVTLLAGLVLGLYLWVESAAGTGGWVAVPVIGGALQLVLWLAVYAVWATPAGLPALRWLAIRNRSGRDGVQP